VRTGFIWLGIWFSGRLLWTREGTIRFHKMWRFSCLAEGIVRQWWTVCCMDYFSFCVVDLAVVDMCSKTDWRKHTASVAVFETFQYSVCTQSIKVITGEL
jgi:hypothetical protein